METAMWLASIFGPFLVIMGLWMLLYSDNVVKVFASIRNTPAAFYVGGVMNLLVGLTILSMYQDWYWDLTIFVTLLGWLLLLRGVLVLYMPQLLIKTTMTNLSTMKWMGIIPLVWGALLCWLAFATASGAPYSQM
jgi:hypothetical protein